MDDLAQDDGRLFEINRAKIFFLKCLKSGNERLYCTYESCLCDYSWTR